MKTMTTAAERKERTQLTIIQKDGYRICGDCGGLIVTDYEWLGENKDGVGVTRHHETCEDCGRWLTHDELGG